MDGAVSRLDNGLTLDLPVINVVEKAAAIIDVSAPFEHVCAPFEAVRNVKRGTTTPPTNIDKHTTTSPWISSLQH
jgi:hypothetical protein